MRRHSGFGFLELVVGILLILLGIMAFVKPELALSSLVLLTG